MNISKYISFNEATKSQTAIRLGIENIPNEAQLANMKYVATEIFDPVREFVGGQLYVSSFFRSKELNQAISGSSLTSQHITGQAIDIDADTFGYGTNTGIFKFILDNLVYDQLILEYPDDAGKPSWIHVSKTTYSNRNQALVKLKSGYIPYSSWKIGMI